MAEVFINSAELVITLSAVEGLQALRLKRGYRFEISQVRGATEDSTFFASGIGTRMPGFGFPGLIAVGTFRKNGQKVLSFWRRGQQVVIIELADAPWDRLAIGCRDARRLAAEINDVLANQS